MADQQPQLNIQAVYTAPGTTQTFQHAIPTESRSQADSFAAKQAHLTALQSLVATLQEEVNVFLTEKMEEDKKAHQGVVSKKEAKEEENYGEEVMEEDA